jgi:hypothetical protein
MTAKRSNNTASRPLFSGRTLGKSLREQHYVKYSMVPKAIGVLGCRGLLLESARICSQDADKSERRGHRHVARAFREAATIFRTAARNMLRVDRRVISCLFGGASPRIARQFQRSSWP